MFVIVVIGLPLITTMATLERQREAGLLIAQGLNKKQVVKIFLGEILLIVVISFTLGILEGLSITYGLLKLPISKLTDFPIKTSLVFPTNFYLLLTAGFITLILTSIVPAWHLTRKNIAKILRIHH